jgi:hypothetical protein
LLDLPQPLAARVHPADALERGGSEVDPAIAAQADGVALGDETAGIGRQRRRHDGAIERKAGTHVHALPGQFQGLHAAAVAHPALQQQHLATGQRPGTGQPGRSGTDDHHIHPF